MSTARAAAAHLRLAEGLIKTAEISAAASEYEIRNAFSRSYYALFHACCGYLLAQNEPNANEVVKNHGRLHSKMYKVGKAFGDDLTRCYELRRKADYDADWSVPPYFSCVERLKRDRGNLYYVRRTAKNLIAEARAGV